MPHFWGNILVVTKDELVPKYFNTMGTLKSLISRYKDLPYGIKKVQKGGNGRQLLIDFDSLPKEMQDSIGDIRKMKHPLLKHWEINPLAVRYYTDDFRFDDGTPLKMDFIEEYITNASVLIALNNLKEERLAEWATKRKGKKTGLMESLRGDLITFNKYLPKIHHRSHTLEVGERHFVRLFKTFLNEDEGTFNFSSLISGKLKSQNARKMTDAMIALLNQMFAGVGSKPTRTQVADKYQGFLDGEVEIINNETGEVYDPTDNKKFKPMSESSIVAWLGMWENQIGTLPLRSDNRQNIISRFVPYHSLEKVKEAGVLISIDDRQPPFYYNKNKNRMWFYMGIDLGSEAWVSWVYGENKNEAMLVEFYRQMVRNYTQWGFNLPLELECESHLNSLFRDTLLRNGAMFDRVRIEANKARAKHVERYFGKLRYEFEKDKTGWLGRPNARKEDNQRGSEKEIILPQEEIIKNSLYDIQKWNNMEHRLHKGKSRWEVFCEMQCKDTKPTNWRAILPYIGKVTKTRCRAGIVKFRSSEWLLALEGEIALGEDLIRLMKYVEGKEIEIYWLDANDGNILKAMVYYDDMLLCELLPKPTYARSFYEMDEVGRLNRQLMSAYENTVNGYMKQRKNQIDSLTIIDRRSVVLNNKFTIAELEGFTPREEPAQLIDTDEAEPEFVYQPKSGRLSKGLTANF